MLELNLIGPSNQNYKNLVKTLAKTFSNPKALVFEQGIINLKFVQAAEMRKLNNSYSGQDYATDVLSFNYQESSKFQSDELGDIVVNLDQAKVQASQYGLSLNEELANLIVHGVLHIFGHDHATKSEQSQMENLHNQILKEARVSSRKFAWV